MSRKLVGNINVDAGLCWIGDPCYVLHGGRPELIGKDWGEFCSKLFSAEEKDGDVRTKAWGDGVGVSVSTGYGDGTYPVYVEYNDEGRVASVTVQFIDPNEGDSND